MKNKISRVSVDFDHLLGKWSRQGGMSKVQVSGLLAKKMQHMDFKPEIPAFKEPDLADSFMKRSRKKRGSVSDVLWFVPMFFVAVVIALVASFALDAFNTEVQADADASADAKTTLGDYEARYPTAMDNGLVLAFVSIHIGIIIVGLFLRTHPIMFPVLMIAVLFLSLLAGYMSNAWNDDVASDADLNAFANEFPKSSWLLDNYVMVTLVFAFIDVLLFATLSNLTGGGP